MPIPRIYTEDMFPLNEEPAPGRAWPEDWYPENEESFPVLVDWHDVEESPSQAVVRLNDEVLEKARDVDRLHRKLRSATGVLAALNEFEVETAGENPVRRVRHRRCDTFVAGLPNPSAFLMGDVITILRDHDCSIAARIAANDNARAMTGRAVALLDGSDETMDAEYLRALTEMVYEAAGLPQERKQEVAAYLWEQASTTGECPTI